MTVVQRENLAAIEIKIGYEVVANITSSSTEVVIGIVALVTSTIKVTEIAAEVIAEVI